MAQTANPSETAAAHDEPPLPVHVLHVADADAFARFGPLFRQLGLALSNEGVASSLLTDDGPGADDLDGTPVEDYWYPALHGLRAWRLESHLRTMLQRPPTVVHLWGVPCLRLFGRWTAARGIPLIVHVTALEQVELLRRRGMRAHERLLASCRALAEPFDVGEPVTVIEPGLLAPREVRSLPVTDQHTLGIIFAGRIDADAGLELLIDAVKMLRQRELDVQVALIGDGPATDAVWQRAVRCKVADCVSMTDGPRIWEQALPGADICVVPACQKRIGLAPLLAMAHGRVVIASDDQIASWFVPAETALVFEAGRADALVAQVRRVMEGHPAALAVGRAARAYVREHHAITRMASRLAQVYREPGARMLS